MPLRRVDQIVEQLMLELFPQEKKAAPAAQAGKGFRNAGAARNRPTNQPSTAAVPRTYAQSASGHSSSQVSAPPLSRSIEIASDSAQVL